MTIKNAITYLNLILVILHFSSCSVLQWRETDSEIKSRFNTKNIPTKISYFEVDSLKLNIRIQSIESKKNKTNLVFLHGSPSSLSAWNGYLTDSILFNNANIYAIDRPGYGYSNFGKAIPSIDTQAQLLHALLIDKNIKNCILIGTSYGGPIAARLAFYNKNIKAVVMVSPAIDPNNEKSIWGSRLTQWFLTRWLVPTGYRVAGDEKTVHANELSKIEADWSKISQPIIHIHGDADNLVPYKNIDYTKHYFKNNTIISIPNKGHEIAWKHPELIIPHILKLIDNLK